ncbi:hypothetical protein EDC65_4774 [Stella humosa]|uniref:MOSC domain-containing protein n=1 Tax=Stella humosa TaxID=94 RepID=A0A3N1KRM0_9PROT|nr:MOSC domain-containing protein [Stella humosa]ROP83241.1 hypothetical protein EDC65_4774 [Stella humosa]BBK29977.1 molybdenum cofactor sulfurase [Stella humosa]
MTEAPRIRSIWRYPVSSMGGERLERAEAGPGGLQGDRLWGVVAEDGEIASPKQRRWRATPLALARLGDEDRLELRLPSQGWQPADQAELAAHFGFPVRLVRHPAPGLAPDIPTVAPRYDVRALHLVTTASLATLAERLPGSAVDLRRFRPNLVVDWPDRTLPFPESEWPAGMELMIGGTRLRVLEPCRRCAFVTIPQPDLDLDPAILDQITRTNRADFGALLAVAEPGPIAVGDRATLA